jgi:hypothetical protein
MASHAEHINDTFRTSRSHHPGTPRRYVASAYGTTVTGTQSVEGLPRSSEYTAKGVGHKDYANGTDSQAPAFRADWLVVVLAIIVALAGLALGQMGLAALASYVVMFTAVFMLIHAR